MRFLFPLTIDCHGLLYNSTGKTKINFGNFDNYWASVFWKPQTSCYETLCVLRTTFFFYLQLGSLAVSWGPLPRAQQPRLSNCPMLIIALCWSLRGLGVTGSLITKLGPGTWASLQSGLNWMLYSNYQLCFSLVYKQLFISTFAADLTHIFFK